MLPRAFAMPQCAGIRQTAAHVGSPRAFAFPCPGKKQSLCSLGNKQSLCSLGNKTVQTPRIGAYYK